MYNVSSMNYGFIDNRTRLNCISETDPDSKLCMFMFCVVFLSHQITAIKNHSIKRGIWSDMSPAPVTVGARNAPVQAVKAHVWTWEKGRWQKQDRMNPHEDDLPFSLRQDVISISQQKTTNCWRGFLDGERMCHSIDVLRVFPQFSTWRDAQLSYKSVVHMFDSVVWDDWRTRIISLFRFCKALLWLCDLIYHLACDLPGK